MDSGLGLGWIGSIGVFVTLLGLLAIGYCIWGANKVRRRDDPNDGPSRDILKRLVAINLAGVSLATLGLMLVILALVL